MKTYLLIIFTICSLISSGQTYPKKNKRMKTPEKAIAFIKVNPDLKGELIEIIAGTDNSEAAKKIISATDGKPVVEGSYSYKVLETRKSFLLNAFYIYFDGNKLSLLQIDSLRQIIISKYNAGAPFSDLAKEYNMDGNPEPNLKSIPEGYLVRDFSEAVKAHNKDDVFKIDVPNKKWYYVTQKTANNQETSIYSVLKIKIQ